MIAAQSLTASDSTEPDGNPPLGIDFSELRPLTIDEYHRLIKLGFFTPDDRVELIDGYLVKKMPQDDPHAVSVNLIPDAFTAVLPGEWIVRPQLPITLAGNSEPEPDVVVCLGPKRRYSAGHPTVRDIAIVIEVADTTLRRDRGLKLRAYARNRVPVYWIVNLVEEQVELYTGPRSGRSPGYRSRADFGRRARVPVQIKGKTIGEVAVKDLLS